MRRFLLAIAVLLMGFVQGAWAQSQKVKSGNSTQPVNFAGCVYNWVNDTPGIGLAASGTGDINSFKAINNGNAPIVATIKATSIPVQYAYIPGSTGITVINTSTNAVVTTIPVAYSSANVAATPDGTRVYVSDPLSNSVYVINTSTNTVMATIPVGVLPSGITVTPDGKTVFVGNYDDNSISVISTATNTVTTVLSGFDRPFQLRTAPVGNLLYVLSQATGNTWVVNTTNNTIVSTLPFISEPWDIAISADGTRLYIVGESDNSVHVFNGTTYAAIATIPVGLTPENITISPDGSSVYVGCFNSAYVAVISTATNTVTRKLTMGAPQGLALSADGKTLFAVNNYFGTLNAIDLTTGNITSTLSTGFGATAAGNFLATVSCPPLSFTITVNPAAAAVPTIAASPVTGGISACAGTASASPQLQQVTISGSNLIDNITASVPSIFEISTSPNSGYSGSVVLPQTGGTVNPTTLYIRSKATAPVGTASGYVTLSSVGWTPVGQGPAITETVRALPTVNTVSNQTWNNGQTTAAVNFTGTGNPYIWTNDMPGIGLAASGSGNILPFTAVNTGATAITATVTATPTIEGLAYIDDYSNNAVTVINPVTNTVIKSIPVGTNPWGVVISPDGSRVYITNFHGNSVSVIDTKSNTVIKTVGVGIQPYGLTVSADGSRIYVGAYGGANISVIDAASLTVIGTITGVTSVYDVVLSLDGTKLYAVEQTGQVAVINLADYSIITTIPVGVQPIAIAITPDGSQLYVTNSGSATVSVINTATNTVTATLPVGVYPSVIAVSPDGGTIYVGNLSSNYISVISTATNTVVAPITNNSTSITGLSVSSDGAYLYAVNLQGSMFVISTASGAIINPVTVPPLARGFGKFIASGGCPGSPVQFTITVNPTTAALPTITAGPVTGTISACAGTASVFPNVQETQVSGTDITGVVSLTAPNGFEISLSGTTGFSNSLTLTPVGGAVNSTAVYVRIAATAPAGSNSANIEGTSPGAKTIEIPVAGTVNALPTVNSVGPQTLNNGQTTTAINFTGTGNTFTWTNDTPGIGLAASGTGDIPSFTAVNIGSNPIIATVAVTPMPAGFAYIANALSNNVSVISAATNSVVATIPVGAGPYCLAVDQHNNFVYVSNLYGNSVSVINSLTNKVISTITVGLAPYGVTVSPDGSHVYVANQNSNSVSVINTSTNTVISAIPTGASPGFMACSPDGNRLYVTNFNSNNISVINTKTDKLITNISVGSYPFTLYMSPDGSRLYLLDVINSNNLSIINTATNSVIGSFTVDQNSTGLCGSPDGKWVYISNIDYNTVSVFSTSTNSIVSTIAVGQQPGGLSISPDGSQLYVVNGNFSYGTANNKGTVSIINTETNIVSATITIGANPVSYGDFVTSGEGCTGPPTKFTITVNPTFTPTPGINFTQPTGTISACEGTASASPNIQQFTVSGNTLSGDITVAAPAGFEISLSPTTGYTGIITLAQTGGTVNNTVIYVRSAASAPAGPLAGNVTLTSIGVITQTVDVAGTVNTLPIIDPVNNQKLVTGMSTTPVVFAGTSAGLTFNWTNDEPGIGLPASGTGNIASFTTFNQGNTPITATIRATPVNATGCDGLPIQFTIEVDPIEPTIVNGPYTGNISACVGSVSVSPAIAQFTVSGVYLIDNITVAAPTDFQVSLSPTSGFTGTLTLKQTGGIVNNTVIYVRSLASAPVGVLQETITIISGGAETQFETATATTYPLLSVNPVGTQSFLNGQTTPPITFAGTGDTYTWTNSNPAIGLPASGTGDIGSFTAVNTGTTPITAKITVTAQSTTGCPGSPTSFTITVSPFSAVIKTSGTLQPLTTTYGTPSSSESFSVSGTTLSGGILVTPPVGFELSTDNINFSPTVTVGSGGTIPNTPVYIRLAAISPVSGYSGNIALTNAGAATVNVAMPLSTVTPAPLTISADNQTRIFNTPNPLLTATYIGFVNNENPTFLTSQPVLSTTALLSSPPGQYAITVIGAASPNYTITQLAGVLTITPNQIVVPNTFTPNGDGVNDTWNIGFLNTYTNCTVDIFTRWGQKVYTSIGYGMPWDGSYKGAALPIGTYYYIINLKNGSGPLSGFVALIR